MTLLEQQATIKYACGCSWLLIPGVTIPAGCPDHHRSHGLLKIDPETEPAPAESSPDAPK